MHLMQLVQRQQRSYVSLCFPKREISQLEKKEKISPFFYSSRLLKKLCLTVKCLPNNDQRISYFSVRFLFSPQNRDCLVKVFNHIRIDTDPGRTKVLVLLDLSEAFDTGDKHHHWFSTLLFRVLPKELGLLCVNR